MPRRLPPAFAVAVLLPWLLLPAAAASAQEEPIELADDPFEITDPRAAPPGEAELSLVGSYTRAQRARPRHGGGGNGAGARRGAGARTPRRPNRRLRPPRGAPQARPRLRPGRRHREQRAGLLGRRDAARRPVYQLADERGALPAIGLLGRMRTLYGPGRKAYKAEAVALIAKTLLGKERPFGVHVNLGWVARLGPLPGERPNRYLVNASVGQTVSHDTALVATYARERQECGQRDFSLVQLGIRQRLPGGRSVFGVAAGAGIGRDSPRFQLGFAVQWELGGGGR